MTTWRVSVERSQGDLYDLHIDTTDDATLGELREGLVANGFDRRDLRLDGVIADNETVLNQSPVRHGSLFSPHPMSTTARSASTTTPRPAGARSTPGRSVLGGGPEPDSGWYLVAVAGPDTGAWCPIGPEPIVVGLDRNADIQIEDRSLSARHFRVWQIEGGVGVEDISSTSGMLLEGEPLEGQTAVSDGSYFHAGASTFGIAFIDPADIPPEAPKGGPTLPFERRFRAALPILPTTIKFPAAPTERSESGRRPLMSFAIPIILAVGLAVITGSYLFLSILALGPIFFVVDGIRRRKIQAQEDAEQQAEYQQRRYELLTKLQASRYEELRRDRWAAAPAGLAALLTTLGHQRLWERSTTDPDFCEVAIGLHDRPSAITIEGRPEGEPLPQDDQWSAVLRHSLVSEGPLALRGSLERVRALGRSLVMDLATSQSPADVKIWLLTDGHADGSWTSLRWLPHTFLNESQNRIYSSPSGRAAALSALQSVISERRAADQPDGTQEPTPAPTPVLNGVGTDGGSGPAVLPVHIVIIDGVSLLDSRELTDLLVDGAAVGVVGITLDPYVTPEGSGAEVTLGEFSDESTFVSRFQPRAQGVRSFEMAAARLEASARPMAALRPAGSPLDDAGGPDQIRLVDLIKAEMHFDHNGVERAVKRWATSGPASLVPVGGLGDLIVNLDLVKDGPHGLIGGANRAGKTEFLKSFLTALAVNNHPDDLSIVIVDFNGGVDYRLLGRLPHVIELLADHDVDSFVRTVSLLEAELRRRQKLMDTVGDGGVPNFEAYQAARRSYPGLTPLPRLVVVVDEFSELLSSEIGKELLAALEGLTRVGGGLGVHLLLATQNLESQLPSTIAANVGMRICFRVQDLTHSKAVLSSGEAASIPKEQIGRAFLRSHGERAVEFQAAWVAGPRAGQEAETPATRIRLVPFTCLSDEPPEIPDTDVPVGATDMFAVIEVLRAAAQRVGWHAPVVPWPKELPVDLTLAEVKELGSGSQSGAEGVGTWPLGLFDEPDLQRQRLVGLEPYGPSLLLLGGQDAGLGDVLRSVLTAGTIGRSPQALHLYIVDLLGQGLSVLGDLPHVGGIAEQNEPLALRMIRYLATEVGRRKALLHDLGRSSADELSNPADQGFPEIVLAVNGADRLILDGESNHSPMLPLMLGLILEAVGTGVRVIMTGPPSITHHRIGSAIGRRLVFGCADPQEYTGVGVPRHLQGLLGVRARAVDVNEGRLVQVAMLPSDANTPATEVVMAVGHRLQQRWGNLTEGLPHELIELPWPLPFGVVETAAPPPEVRQPVPLAVESDRGELVWLDAEEDGPVFFICGPSRSGRSSALLAAARLMAVHGWFVLGLPLSPDSPLALGRFMGTMTTAEGLAERAENGRPVALFIDDIQKWTADAALLSKILDGPGPRAIVAAGPPEFLSGRNDVTRTLSARAGLILSPRKSTDGAPLGVNRLDAELLRDERPGNGLLVVGGELFPAQVPFVG